MKLLLDEDSQGRVFTRLMREAGHDVETVNDAGLVGKPDPVVLAYAKQAGRVLLTRNGVDFAALHQADSAHPGILIEYQHDDISKNMTNAQIVAAIGKIEASDWDIRGALVSVNAWQ